jgi:hypothetical protein
MDKILMSGAEGRQAPSYTPLLSPSAAAAPSPLVRSDPSRRYLIRAPYKLPPPARYQYLQ